MGSPLAVFGIQFRSGHIIVDTASVGIEFHIHAVHRGTLAHNESVLGLDRSSSIATVHVQPIQGNEGSFALIHADTGGQVPSDVADSNIADNDLISADSIHAKGHGLDIAVLHTDDTTSCRVDTVGRVLTSGRPNVQAGDDNSCRAILGQYAQQGSPV